MKTTTLFSFALLALILAAPVTGQTQFTQGQNFLGGLPPSGSGMEGAMLAASAPDSAAFADGTRAINESRWGDAVNIFTYVAHQQSVHADGALYWKAYAENKLGQTQNALDVCAQLRHDFPSSSWIHECGALEIEIRTRSGQPPQPKAQPDESLKLLALNEMMKRDEPRALAGLQEILNSDASARLKQEAQFILSQHYSDDTYAQIVRISYLEGDVRIARGEENVKATGAAWEKAVANLPLETGYSMVTGDGRVEIEFEDASTIYLADHSVLLFSDLHTTAGIPYTELALLSGTVTLHVQPYVSGEAFILKTPTGRVSTVFPKKAFLRVGSYTDGMTLNEQKEEGEHLAPGEEQAASAPKPPLYFDGKGAAWLPASDSGAFAEWDKWVKNRVEQRSAAIAEVMQASGLDEPIPGMADMQGKGRFFPCQPYGTCWEPNAAGPPQSGPQSADHPAAGQAAAQAGPRKAQSSGGGAAPALMMGDEDEFFPCFPLSSYGYWSNWSQDPDGAGIIDSAYQLGIYSLPYDWAVCHAGGWVNMHNRYVWVAGHKRHHRGPGRWIKHGRQVALVPVHPWDVKGRPPINRFEEVLALSHNHGLRFERTRLDPTSPFKLLDAPPREFNKAIYPVLARAEEPRMEVHAVKDVYFASNDGNRSGTVMKGELVKHTGTPLHFDPRTQNFTMVKQVVMGNRSVTVPLPINNHGGNLQSRAGNYSGSSGSRSGNSYSGSGGGYHGGSSGYSGGSSHSGGGGSSSASSGGSHSSGGSSGVSSPSAAPSAPSAPSGGSSAASSSSVHH